MLNATRQSLIYEYIKQHTEVGVADLIKKFQVADMTIRRDLSKLQDMGLIRRVHGGAVLVDTSHRESTFTVRSIANLESKRRIAEKAVEFISEGSSLFIDGSTTCSELAKILPDGKNLTIFTNSLAFINEMKSEKKLDNLVLLGGELSKDENTFDGTFALELASKIYVDCMFFSCSGFSQNGISNAGLIGTQVKKIILNNSKKHVLLADSSKYDNQGLYMLCKMDEIQVLITDKGLRHEAHDELSKSVELILA